MMKKYLVVAEGPTDFVVLKEIANAIAIEKNEEIKLVELSPQLDATTSSYPPHGWSGVRTWCRKHQIKTPEAIAHLDPQIQKYAARQSWSALLAIESADGLIIQMDCDIAEEIQEPYQFQPGSCRVNHSKNGILEWLGLSQAPKEIFLAISSQSLETWILALHPPTDPVFKDLQPNFCYEDITDVEDRLIKLGYSSRRVKGRMRIRKSPYTTYESYGKEIASNLPAVRERCSTAHDLCLHLES